MFWYLDTDSINLLLPLLSCLTNYKSQARLLNWGCFCLSSWIPEQCQSQQPSPPHFFSPLLPPPPTTALERSSSHLCSLSCYFLPSQEMQQAGMRDTLQACLCSESSQDWKEVSVSALCLHFRSTAKAPFPSFVVHVLGHLTFGSSLSQSVQAFSTELGIALKFSSSSIISPNFSQLDTHFQLPLRLPSKRNMRCLSSYALQMDQRPLSWLPDSWRFCRWYLWQALRPVSWIPPYALADTPGKHSLLWLSEFSWSSISHSPEAPCFLTLAGIDLRQHREGLWCRGQLPRRGMAGTVPGPPSPSADHFLPCPQCV